MNIIITLALIMVLAGGLYHRVTLRSKVLSSQTLFSTPTLTPNEAPQGEVGLTPIPKPTTHNSPLPTKVPTPPVTVTVTVTPTSDWQYPGSNKTSSNTYESTDSSDTITDWYQNKIKALGFNVKTFVRTKSNDRVLNKLVGANGQTEIRVEISKNPSDPVTRITINY